MSWLHRMMFLIGLSGGVTVAGIASAADGFSGDVEDISSSSSQEKLAFANDAGAEMESANAAVEKLKEGAEREGRAEQLQCLTNRLTALVALGQVSDFAETSMTRAISGGEDSRADREFIKIVIALKKSRQLLSEAEGCGFDSLVRSGATEITVEGGEFEEDDDTEGLDFDFEVGFDAPEASPFY